jgi:cysteinyl-tRNA synthetase
VLCRASGHLPEQIAMIRTLEEKGYTYRIEDGIYFDVSKFPRYAEFAGLDLAAQEAGARIGDVPGKRHAADFALWKFAPPGARRQQEWDSPWGRGFPGWHIECSAMSTRYLGTRFDIHTGGVEHVKVHHTNEIAQSESAFDVHPWVQIWMHEDWIVFQGEKMSKSRGSVYVLQDLVDRGWLPLSYRYFVLQAHYRKQQSFHDEAMAAADRGYRRLRAEASALGEAPAPADAGLGAGLRERFRVAVRDDLNAPRALAVAQETVQRDDLPAPVRRALLGEFDAWLGLDLLEALPAPPAERDPGVEARLAEREAARVRRDFAAADRIRRELEAEGVLVEDTPDGPRWRRR